MASVLVRFPRGGHTGLELTKHEANLYNEWGDMERISVIGAGSWGTALAVALARKGRPVKLWAYEPEIVRGVAERHENELFLPGIALPSSIEASNSLAEVLDGAGVVLTVMPSHICRILFDRMIPFLDPDMVLVSATKGIDTDRLMRMSEVIRDVVRQRFEPRLCVLSGPSFAKEVALGHPTAVVVASEDRSLAITVQNEFSSTTLRLYTSTDVVGVELGGALKNVIAIAAGVIEGLDLGHNVTAALITRGLAEMTRLACTCGARRETMAGLAGIGDLALTCTGSLSRNRTVGVELGRGRKLADIVNSTRMVAEGVKTTRATLCLAERHGVDVPITREVHRILEGEVAPLEAIRTLMERSLKDE
jgi:glycerol-3-phosphate dehydrogenase (NAD(P)+)